MVNQFCNSAGQKAKLFPGWI